MTYLILVEMGFNDKDICRILYVKDSTVRNYRMRISKKTYNDKSVALAKYIVFISLHINRLI